MTRNVSIEDATVEITAGLYDTSEGFRAQVEGDDFPRVHVTPQGEVLTGDGTAPPTAYSTGGGGGGVVPQTRNIAINSVEFGENAWTEVVALNRDGTEQTESRAYLVDYPVLVVENELCDSGFWTLHGADNPATFDTYQPADGELVTTRGGGGAVLWVRTGDEYLLVASYNSGEYRYDNAYSSLASNNVQGAIDELAALIAAL